MHLSSSVYAYSFIKKHLENKEVEEFWALALSCNLRALDLQMIFRGTVDGCIIHPRDIYRFAIKNNASRLLVAHNHPSQELKPSTEDILITEKLIAAGQLLEIPLIDHLIIIKNNYISMADKKICTF